MGTARPSIDGEAERFAIGDVAERHLAFLLRATTELLAEPLDSEELLGVLTALAVPHLADWCVVDLVEPDGSIRRSNVAHVDPSGSVFADELRRRVPGGDGASAVRSVVRTGAPILIRDVRLEVGSVPEAWRRHVEVASRLGGRSLLVVPVRARGEVLGAMSLVYGVSGRRHDEDDLAAAEDLGWKAGIVLLNARALAAEKKARQEAREVQHLFTSALDQLPVGVVLVEARSERVLFANRVVSQMLGSQSLPGSLRDHAIADRALHLDGSRYEADEWPLVRVLQRGEIVRADRMRVLHEDGTWGVVEINAAPVRNESGQVIAAAAAGIDVTQAVAAEEERARVERFREQLLGIVGHDLRTPLSAILMSAAQLARRKDVDERVSTSAARIASSAQRAERMIRELLDYTQARLGGGIPVLPAPTDLSELAAQIIDEVRAAHPERAIEYSSPAEVSGEWDRERIGQVLTNLLANALEHGKPGTTVRVELRAGLDCAQLAVTNEGEPIPAERLAGLFEPFRHGAARGPRRKGLGLGLYIVKQIVDAHGGTIEATSSGMETRFVARLPRRAHFDRSECLNVP